MPEDARKLYDEAASVMSLSPRSACALLRLCTEKLCDALGAKEKSYNAKATLVDKVKALKLSILTDEAVKAFDIVRMCGNKAVHSGFFDEGDNKEMVTFLFTCVNFIVRQKFHEPQQLAEVEKQVRELSKSFKKPKLET
jgi:hypothetical protein